VKRLSAAAVVAVLVLTGWLSVACSAGPPRPSDPVLAKGYDIFQANCAACHGTTGGGGIAPKLKGVVATRYPNIADQIAVISNGRMNMPAWKDRLSADEIEAVARYEREGL
jgi:mono/diheme cytochrome c family protein